jgi:hypothetical protein
MARHSQQDQTPDEFSAWEDALMKRALRRRVQIINVGLAMLAPVPLMTACATAYLGMKGYNATAIVSGTGTLGSALTLALQRRWGGSPPDVGPSG